MSRSTLASMPSEFGTEGSTHSIDAGKASVGKNGLGISWTSGSKPRFQKEELADWQALDHLIFCDANTKGPGGP